MSPLTMSYFTCWAFFDACVGPANETIGTTILEVGAAFGMHTDWNDFVFEGYVNHRTDAIDLAGLPDVPESRPHSGVNSRRFRR